MRFHKLPYAVALLILIYPNHIVAQQDQQESSVVSGKGGDPSSTEQIRTAAEQGNVSQQFELGSMYANGNGVTQDYIQAYMWLTLSAEGTMYRPGNPNYQIAADLRDSIVKKMTPQQIEEAKRLAKEWESNFMQKFQQGTDDYLFMLGWGLTAPVALAQPKPPYPLEARKARVGGTVRIQCIIRKDGTVDSCEIVQRLGWGLEEAAIKTITTKWRFKPGTLNGKPVDVLANIEVNFKLQN